MDNKIPLAPVILGQMPPQDGDSPKELYDECVRVAGKSFCDFLFKK
jgi:hypothetical protein